MRGALNTPVAISKSFKNASNSGEVVDSSNESEKPHRKQHTIFDDFIQLILSARPIQDSEFHRVCHLLSRDIKLQDLLLYLRLARQFRDHKLLHSSFLKVSKNISKESRRIPRLIPE